MKKPLRGPRIKWKVNIKRNLEEIGCEDVNWIGLAQNRDWWRFVMNTNAHTHKIWKIY